MLHQLQPGDIILVPKENSVGIYNFISDVFGRSVATTLARLYNHNYIHAELSLGNGWQVGAWADGVRLWKPSISYYPWIHVYRLKPEYQKITKEKVYEATKKVLNKRYDFPSLILNAVIELISLGKDEPFQAYFKYENKDELICSELVARVYEDFGIHLGQNPEYTSPDDIAESTVLYRVL